MGSCWGGSARRLRRRGSFFFPICCAMAHSKGQGENVDALPTVWIPDAGESPVFARCGKAVPRKRNGEGRVIELVVLGSDLFVATGYWVMLPRVQKLNSWTATGPWSTNGKAGLPVINSGNGQLWLLEWEGKPLPAETFTEVGPFHDSEAVVEAALINGMEAMPAGGDRWRFPAIRRPLCSGVQAERHGPK
jgi:hypothetical protein